MDIKKFITNETFGNDYNQIIQDEITMKKIYKVSEFDFLLPNSYNSIKNIFNNNNNVYYSGSQVKKLFDKSPNVNYKKDYTVYTTDKIDINIPFTETIHHYVYIDSESNSDITYNLDKKTFTSINHIFLETKNVFDRIVLNNNELYVSGLFILELYKKVSTLCLYKDPVFNVPEDVFDIFDKNVIINKDAKYYIDTVNLSGLQELTIGYKDYINYNNNKYTVIEYAIQVMVQQTHPIIVKQMRQIVLYLNKFEYIRPPSYVCKMLEFDKKHIGTYKLLKNNNVIDNFNNINNVHQIDMYIIKNLIVSDNVEPFIKYISDIDMLDKLKVSDKITDWIISNKSIKIITHLCVNKLLSEYNFYKIILLTEQFNLLGKEFIDKYILKSKTQNISRNIKPKNTDVSKNDNFKNEILKNEIFNQETCDIIIELLPEVLKKGLTKSFHVITKLCPHICETSYNILHMLKSDNCLDILKLLIIHNSELIKNDNLLLSYVENNMYECILELLNNGITYDNVLDGSNNTILHLLCKKRVKSDIISQIFRKTIKIIDKQNEKLMTPIMIASIEGNEDLFWLLKGFNPNMDLTDIYGNTVYHYVCRSRICPSMSIINSKNKFGYTPKDYLQINPNFYYFI
jgi:hypothetical protein